MLPMTTHPASLKSPGHEPGLRRPLGRRETALASARAWIDGYSGIWVLLALALTALPGQAQPAATVRPQFENRLTISTANPPTTQSSSAYCFSGHRGAYSRPGSTDQPVVPSTTSATPIRLVESSIGQMLAAEVPAPRFIEEAIAQARTNLYPAANSSRVQIENSQAIFRYKFLLYGASEGKISADVSKMDTWYGPTERSRFPNAVLPLRNALKYAPLDRRLQHALLDAYYDRYAAEVQLVKQHMGERAELRLLGADDLPEGSFIIDQEIEITTAILSAYTNAMTGYSELLNDRMGVDVDRLGVEATPDMPFGAFLLQWAQPGRNQVAAQFVNDQGALQSVPTYNPETGQVTIPPGERVLFAGYKDYVALLGLLRDYGAQGAELARLLAIRGGPGDRAKAQTVITEVQQQLSLSEPLLRGMFPDYNPPPGDASGVLAARSGIEASLGELNSVQGFLAGANNALGFAPNFLVLIQEFPDSTQGNQFDSYDALVGWIQNTQTSPLSFAESFFNQAQERYTDYRGAADQLYQELDDLEDAYADRYVAITGYDPGEVYDPSHAEEPMQGSELWQVNQEISLAAQRYESATNQVEAVNTSLAQAQAAQGLATDKADAITTALSNWQGVAKDAWEEIRSWSIATAGVQAAYDTVADVAGASDIKGTALLGGVAIGGAVNYVVQASGADNIARAEGRLDFANAQFEADLAVADFGLLQNQAQFEVSSLLREQITAAFDMKEALALRIQQEGRKEALLRELARLGERMESDRAELHDRYFADPVHQLRAQSAMLLAEQYFRQAQRWVFFTVRALEFKWNKDFAVVSGGKTWDRGSLFRLRNFAELEQFVAAMEDFNTINLLGFTREAYTDVLSLKRDFIVPAGNELGENGPFYDLESSDGTGLTATGLFRRHLNRSRDADGNLVLRFNTFSLRKDSGFFFLGPRYRSDGTVLSAGKYADKIDWIKINVVGDNFQETVRDASLSYGGTCYLRTRVPPCGDPARPDELPGEFRPFPFFYFYTLDNGNTWKTRATQSDTVKLFFSSASGEPQRGVPQSELENRFLKERSVAATEWTLTIPSGHVDLNQVRDIEIYVKHLSVSREVPDCN